MICGEIGTYVTRNQVYGNVPRVRIPTSQQNKGVTAESCSSFFISKNRRVHIGYIRKNEGYIKFQTISSYTIDILRQTDQILS